LNKLRLISVALILYFSIALFQLLWVEISQQRISLKNFVTQLNPPKTLPIEAIPAPPLMDLKLKTKIGVFEKKSNGSNFIWITSTGEAFEISNENNQSLEKTMRFILEDNPCEKMASVIISTINFKQTLEVKKERQIVEIPLKINGLSSQTILMSTVEESNTNPTCKVTNGDPRDFVAEVNNIMFD